MERKERLSDKNIAHLKNSIITDISFEKDGSTRKLILTNEKGYRLHCSSHLSGWFVANIFQLEYPE